jgi:hypothetical protein
LMRPCLNGFVIRSARLKDGAVPLFQTGPRPHFWNLHAMSAKRGLRVRIRDLSPTIGFAGQTLWN